MTKTQFKLGILAIFTAILLHNLTSPNRYRFSPNGSSLTVIDGVTGVIWMGSATKGWIKIVGSARTTD
jgi:hypothetical protein